MSDIDYSEVTSRIDYCLEKSGDEVLEKGENDSGEVVAWAAKRRNGIYNIVKSDHGEFLEIYYQFDIIQTIANQLDESHVSTILESKGGDVDTEEEDLSRIAARILLRRTPENVRTQFAYSLVQLLSHPRLQHHLNLEEGFVSGFAVIKRIYPHNDSFRFMEFDESVQTVVTIGTAAKIFTDINLDFDSALGDYSDETPPYIS